ncbi:MAG: cyclic nucleotide-binding domain-containing protein [Actinomycetota bacterium]|nr:cyclic nucleotide-binding domain-containing protein [Actinomycetota bacterium]
MTDASELRAQLETIPLFARCSPADLRLLSDRCDIRSVAAGAMLIREGEEGDEFYVILDGKAEVRRRGGTVAVLGVGSHFGELALLDPAPRDADVVMSEPGTVGVLSRSALLLLFQAVPGVGRDMLAYLARRLRDAEVGETTDRL